MLFSAPIPFAEALNSRKVKALMPSSLSSAEWKEVPRHLRELASFSAKVEHAEILDRFDQLTSRIVNPTRVMRDGQPVTVGLDYATARLEMKKFLREEFRYQPDPEKRGTIQDLSSDKRINLKLQTDVQMAQGFGFWQQGQEEAVIDQWPAWELYRAVDKEQRRDWKERWKAVGGKFYGDGRMIALKNDPIWEKLGTEFEDGLGNPYPPFAFGSGMDVKEIDHDESLALGVIKPGQKAKAVKQDFDTLLKTTPSVKSEKLQTALMDQLGDQFDLVDGVLVKHK